MNLKFAVWLYSIFYTFLSCIMGSHVLFFGGRKKIDFTFSFCVARLALMFVIFREVQ